jgi:hypothetical protein
MLVVDEPTAAAIRKAYAESGELSAVVNLRRLFPEIANNENTLGNVCIISQPHADVHCGLDVMGDHLAR